MNKKSTSRSRSAKLLTDSQISQLHALGIRENTSHNDLAWEEQYEAAKAFYAENGHLHIPKAYIGVNGKGVGRWLQTQRRNRKENRLSNAQIRLLDQIGMVWVSPRATTGTVAEINRHDGARGESMTN